MEPLAYRLVDTLIDRRKGDLVVSFLDAVFASKNLC
jgi:hypothetical protein